MEGRQFPSHPIIVNRTSMHKRRREARTTRSESHRRVALRTRNLGRLAQESANPRRIASGSRVPSAYSLSRDPRRETMATKNWDVSGHTVTLRHRLLSGEARVIVDGRTLFLRPRKIFDWGFAVRFDVGAVPCAVRVQPGLLKCRRELIIGPEARFVRSRDRLPFDVPYFLECCVVWSLSLGFLLWLLYA